MYCADLGESFPTSEILARHCTQARMPLERTERTDKMRHAIEEPQNPADACDDIFAEKVDDAAMQQTSPDDIRFF